MKKYSEKNVYLYLSKFISNIYNIEIYDKIEFLLMDYLWTYIYNITLWDNFFHLIWEKNYKKYSDFTFNLIKKLNVEDILKIRLKLIELNKYDFLKFREVFFYTRDKLDNEMYFEYPLIDFYLDFKEYIHDNFSIKFYVSDDLYYRDIRSEILDYVFPILWMELSLKVFNEIWFDNTNRKNFVTNYILYRKLTKIL
jgi:hypothetical protein